MKTITRFILSGLVFLPFCAGAQADQSNFTVALKVSNLARFNSDDFVQTNNAGIPSTITTTTQQFFHPTVAVQWRSVKNNFHEIELTDFKLDKVSTKHSLVDPMGNVISSTNGPDVMTTNIGIRYEYMINVGRSKEKKLIPGIGLAISGYFKQSNSLPQLSTDFPRFERKVGLGFFMIPRLTYHLNSKLFLDINVPLYLLDSQYSTLRQENPVLPIQQRTVSTFNMEAIPKYFSFRIGLGIKL